MKLTELVGYLQSEETLEKISGVTSFTAEMDDMIAYMADKLDIDSDIFFFSMEETDDEVNIEKDGRQYIQLFPLILGVEFYSYFEEVFVIENYTEQQKAIRLLDYVMNDA